MAQQVRFNNEVYWLYNDNRELAKDYAEGEIANGNSIIYKNMLCEVIGDFVDADGERYCMLLPRNMF